MAITPTGCSSGDYVEAIEEGSMTRDGAPEVVSSHGAVETWDARRLPGVWTTGLAIDRATVIADQLGLGAVALRRSHHIACLAAFLEDGAGQRSFWSSPPIRAPGWWRLMAASRR